MTALDGKQVLAAVVFLAAAVVAALQLISAPTVVISVGDGQTEVAELSGYYTHTEVGIVAVATFAMGVCGTYLIMRDVGSNDPTAAVDIQRPSRDPEPPESPSPTDRWEAAKDRLAGNERTIFRTAIEADGRIPQSEIVERTDLSKATVSRGLDKLEARELVERKSHGMGNIVEVK